MSHMEELGIGYLAEGYTDFSKAFIVSIIGEKEFDLFKRNWKSELGNINRPNGSRSG